MNVEQIQKEISRMKTRLVEQNDERLRLIKRLSIEHWSEDDWKEFENLCDVIQSIELFEGKINQFQDYEKQQTA